MSVREAAIRRTSPRSLKMAAFTAASVMAAINYVPQPFVGSTTLEIIRDSSNFGHKAFEAIVNPDTPHLVRLRDGVQNVAANLWNGDAAAPQRQASTSASRTDPIAELISRRTDAPGPVQVAALTDSGEAGRALTEARQLNPSTQFEIVNTGQGEYPYKIRSTSSASCANINGACFQIAR